MLAWFQIVKLNSTMQLRFWREYRSGEVLIDECGRTAAIIDDAVVNAVLASDPVLNFAVVHLDEHDVANGHTGLTGGVSQERKIHLDGLWLVVNR